MADEATPRYIRSRRFEAQRWIVDGAIRQHGVDWDQGRSRYLAQACPVDAAADFTRVRDRVRSFADIDREFAAAARRREALADQARDEGRPVSEREHAFVAAVLWGAAQWPLFGTSAENLAYGERKVACFGRFIEHAPHPVSRVEIPFGSASLPAYLHLPATAAPPHPCVIGVGGMDSLKEHLVAIYGDRYLERGIARLVYDGPGQGESLGRGLLVDSTNAVAAGHAVIDWARSQPVLDPSRLGLSGVSFGSFWATAIAAAVDGLVGCAVQMVVHEPGMRTLFETASPTFKSRFMYMAGYDDEDAFDAFARGLTLDGIGPRVACPYLVVAGEDDDLSPIEHTWELLETIRSPRELVLYQGERHGIAGGPASALGPPRDELVVDWFTDRLAGRPITDRLRYVTTSGAVLERPLGEGRAVGAALSGRGSR
jgi:pimeloyl-ACP methyl ester carboxylesterase